MLYVLARTYLKSQIISNKFIYHLLVLVLLSFLSDKDMQIQEREDGTRDGNVSKALEMVLARLGTQWISTKYVQGFGTPRGIPQKAMDSYTYRQLI